MTYARKYQKSQIPGAAGIPVGIQNRRLSSSEVNSNGPERMACSDPRLCRDRSFGGRGRIASIMGNMAKGIKGLKDDLSGRLGRLLNPLVNAKVSRTRRSRRRSEHGSSRPSRLNFEFCIYGCVSSDVIIAFEIRRKRMSPRKAMVRLFRRHKT